jgi:hypothetical protein
MSETRFLIAFAFALSGLGALIGFLASLIPYTIHPAGLGAVIGLAVCGLILLLAAGEM